MDRSDGNRKRLASPLSPTLTRVDFPGAGNVCRFHADEFRESFKSGRKHEVNIKFIIAHYERSALQQSWTGVALAEIPPFTSCNVPV